MSKNYLLKKLELVGFKSFAEKTVLDLQAGIIAIVGPNGCGKSNIIDAIRWLLGEREAKNLRGAKVEDLIFAGSSKKPKMGLAKATLYFDNKDKFFPLDFSEVTIGREVNRDGSNYYYLNNSEIRLKDLIDFLAKAKLGTHGMIVITQGNSDIFVKASPEQRRMMLEETLGLKEYRLKKREAERRLKNTKINLDKVRALIDEILPHLRSLRRQTSKWQRRGEIEKDLEESLKIFFGQKIKIIKTELEIIENKITEHLKTKNILVQQKQKAENHFKEIESLQPKERERLHQIKSEINNLLKQKNELQKEIVRLEIHLEKSTTFQKNEINLLDKDYSEIINLIIDIKAKLENIIFNFTNLETPKKEIEKIINQIDTFLGKSKDTKLDSFDFDLKLKEDLYKINETLSDIDKKIELLENEEKKLEESQDEFYNIFKKAVEEVRKRELELEQWEGIYRDLIFEKEKLEIKLNDIKHQINQFGRKFEEFDDLSVEYSIDLNQLERKIWKLQGELSSIGEVDQSLISEAEQTEKRYSFLDKELKDLEKAGSDLNILIKELNQKIENEFKKAFSKVNLEFDKFFKIMFGGGYAKLKIVNFENLNNLLEDENNNLKTKETNESKEKNFLETGIDVEVKPPMKKLTSLDVLSGGEKSLVGIAALFAIISVSPPPFLFLDEIDAMLDERNARRFAQMLKEFSSKTQFIVVTHNRAVMEVADIIYGVTLGEDESSKVISLKMEK